jgi:hypothetical protein
MSTPPHQPRFLSTLFDATFSRLLGLRLVRMLYLLAMLFIGTYGFVDLFVGFCQGGVIALLSVFVVPLLALMAIGLVRIALEALVVIFRMGEQTERMSNALSRLSAPPSDRTAETPDG